jgi:hypothetical protein
MGIIEAGSIEENNIPIGVVGMTAPHSLNSLGARTQIMANESTVTAHRQIDKLLSRFSSSVK